MKLRGYNPAQELERKILHQIGQLSRTDQRPEGSGGGEP